MDLFFMWIRIKVLQQRSKSLEREPLLQVDLVF